MATNYRVLLIDHDEDFSQVLENTLNLEGCNVDWVSAGEEALKRMDSRSYDVAIMELNLPDVSGLSLLKRIKEINSEMQVIVLSSADTVGIAVEVIKSGAHDYITKPVMFDEILSSIKKAISKRDRQKAGESETDAAGQELLGDSSYIQKTKELVERAAPTDSTVLLVGESGTGKELMAQEIYERSTRVGKPFVKISCAALPETLLESELFGYERGAFTGATNKKIGLFEVADGGTLFLDEITEVSLGIQAKLLRALQEKEIMRLGGTKPISVDVRFIAASNKDFQAEIKAGRFREDLFYRLNVIVLNTLPLRERSEDISILADYFISKVCEKNKLPNKTVSKEAMRCFQRYQWPGNIRELENVIERSTVLGIGNEIVLQDLPEMIRDAYYDTSAPASADINFDKEVDLDLEVENLERNLIMRALDKSNGVVTTAAKKLNIKRTTLIAKMKKYGIR